MTHASRVCFPFDFREILNILLESLGLFVAHLPSSLSILILNGIYILKAFRIFLLIMNKSGEVETRWPVEERPDATTANAWHWTETKVSEWSRRKLLELLIGFEIKSDLGTTKFTEMSKCDGDAVAISHRGKLIYFYEWHFDVKWESVLLQGAVVKGRIVVFNFTEEQDVENLDVTLHFEDETAGLTHFGIFLRAAVANTVQAKLSQYIAALKDFAKDFFYPTQNSTVLQAPPVSKARKSIRWQPYEKKSQHNSTEKCLEGNNLFDTQTFQCLAQEFYRVLTEKEFVQAFTRSDCVLECREGGAFELFDGLVSGCFIQLQPAKHIALKWRLLSWEKEHYSDVVIHIEQKDNCTEVKLSQFRIPNGELGSISGGWKQHYWDNIRSTFGY